MIRFIVIITIAMLVACCHSEEIAEIYDQILDSQSDADSEDEGSSSAEVNFATRYSNEISLSGLSPESFVAGFRNHCTNIAFSVGNDSVDDSRRRFNAAIDILSEYDAQQAPSLLAVLITNCPSSIVVRRASYAYGKLTSLARNEMLLYRSDAVMFLPHSRRSSAYRGLFSCQYCLDVDSVASNRTISVAQMVQDRMWDEWGYLDDVICRIWPAYATSSNRYMSAVSALETIPPPASTNYINRVITELEALPPGTMQMLSTNHLGAAWNEN